MGSEVSVNTSRTHLDWYESSLQTPCVLPDVSIDETMVKFASLTSNMELRQYSNQLVQSVPDYIDRLGSRLGSLNSVPNAVGLGALVIYLFMDLIFKSNEKKSEVDEMYTMFRRVFAEEKASSVRDTMSEYVARHGAYIHNDVRLLEELQRLETQLSNHLTILKNSLLYDNQMSSRGFKIWANGAAFHLQMVIHQARLKNPSGQEYSDTVRTINLMIDRYTQNLNVLMEKFKAYRISTTEIVPHKHASFGEYGAMLYQVGCEIRSKENYNCLAIHQTGIKNNDPCGRGDLVEAYVNHIFSKYPLVSSLTGNFSDIKQNLDALLKQHDAFNPVDIDITPKK
ncbi:uncharacterized protein LOC107989198 [Cynoglossus semilaevis]|uniref:uncharacterized protein LOC107989198 n=1 Tax=Cynoglossus semilaevis TaxID=244447 RepID=UPI0007DCA640|nr:uncharacterized protein LOC107989198 [Cynoglossus semilaevis]